MHYLIKLFPQPYATAAAKSLQSCLTLCDPIDSSPPDSPVPGILQARTLGWVAISFSNAWKWKVKVQSLSRVQLLATPWTKACHAPPSMGFSRQKNTGVGCHCLQNLFFSALPEITGLYSNKNKNSDKSLFQKKCTSTESMTYSMVGINITWENLLKMLGQKLPKCWFLKSGLWLEDLHFS